MKQQNYLGRIILAALLLSLVLCLVPAAQASTATCEGDVHKGPYTYVLIKSATCTENGSQDKYCSACGQKIGNEPIIAIGHQYIEKVVSETAPTCTQEGQKQKANVCRVCGVYEGGVTSEPVAALGHDWGEWTVTKAPTCTAEGVETRVCKRDSSHVETRPAAATGHKYGNWTVTKAATCTAEGEETRVCANDASHKETRTVAALGHKYDGGKVTKAPTCAAPGVKTFTCQNDPSHTYTEEIPIDPNAHNWDGGKITKAPSCVAPGEKIYTCLNDSSHKKTETLPIDPEAHNWDEGKVTKQPTFKEPGEKIYTCKNDSSHTKKVTLPPTTLYGNTICVFGPRLEDSANVLYPNTTDLWYMYTPFSVDEIMNSPNQTATYEMVASNKWIVGTATITIDENRQLIFDYKLLGNTIKVTYEFYTFLNKITDLTRYEPEELTALNMAATRRLPVDLNENFGDDDLLVLYFCSRADYSYNRLLKELDYNSLPHQQMLNKMWTLMD